MGRWSSCPVCRVSLDEVQNHCPSCEVRLDGPMADELSDIERDIERLETRRRQVLENLRAEQQQLVVSTPPAAAGELAESNENLVRSASVDATSPPASSEPARPEPLASPEAPELAELPEASELPAQTKPGRDLSRHAVRNVLLLLGGVLLGIAIVVFTIVSWGHLGIRAAILSVLTCCALGVPWPLVRRRLGATAETLAYLGLVMVPMSGLAIERALSGVEPSSVEEQSQQPAVFELPDAGVLWWAASWSAVLALGWAGYGRVAPLRLPAPTAVVLAQFPLPLAALALDAPQQGIALALIASALLALLMGRQTNVRIVHGVAAVAGGSSGLVGLALGLAAAFSPLTPVEGLGLSGVLSLGVLLAATCALSLPDDATRWLVSVVAGATAVVALATPLVALLPDRWATAGYAAGGVALVGALGLQLPGGRVAPRRLRQGFAVAASGALAVCVLIETPVVLVAATMPVVHGPSGEMPTDWTLSYAGPVVLAAAALVAAAIARRRPAPLTMMHPRLLRARCRALAVGAAGAGALAVPSMLALPSSSAAAMLLGTTALLLLAAGRARSTPVAPVALGLALYAGLAAVVLSTATAAGATVGSAILLVLLVAAAAFARTPLVRSATAAAGVYAGAVLCIAIGIRIEEETGLWGQDGKMTHLSMLGICLLVVALVRVLPAARAVQARTLDISGRMLALLAVLTGLITWDGYAGLPVAIAALLATATAWSVPRSWWRTTALGQAYLLSALSLVPIHDSVLPALFGPYGWLSSAWTGTDGTARTALGPDGSWQVEHWLVPVLLIAGAAATLAAAAHRGRPAAFGVGRALLPVVLAPVPLAADLPYAAALVFLVLLTVVLAVFAALSASPAGGMTLWLATVVAAWSLADQTATLAVLGALAVVGVASAIGARNSPVASIASSLAALTVGAEGAAFALAGGIPTAYAAFVVLGVAVLTARTAVVLRDRARLSYGLELAAFALWCAAVWMSVAEIALFSLVLAVGGLTTVLAAARRRSPVRIGLLSGAWAMLGLAALLHGLALTGTYVLPYSGLMQPWSQTLENMGSVRDSLGGLELRTPWMAAGAVVALVAIAAVLTGRIMGGSRYGYRIATIAVPAALLPLPMTMNPPYVAGLGFVGLLIVALAARLVVSRAPDLFAGGMTLWLASLLLAWSLYSESGTLVVLTGLVLTAAVVAIGARTEHTRGNAAMGCTLGLGGLAVAGPLADGMALHHLAFAVAGVGAVAAGMAALVVRTRRFTGDRVELAGYGLGVAAVLLTLPRLSATSLLLALTAVLLGAISLRFDRRSVRWVGMALLQLAAWLQLGVLGVTAPEAYTVTVTIAGVIAGWYVRKQRHAFSSWWAYGAPLALTMVPSFVAAWGDPGLFRPTLLATAALVVTLAGAWVRLQAPLLFGGAILVANAARQLGPAAVSLVGEAPRWLPIAVAGTLLLFAGATYEHRLRDLRRIRDSIVRMR